MENKPVQFSAQITGAASRMDKTLLIKINTQELSPEDSARIHGYMGQQIWCAIGETEFTKLDIPPEIKEFDNSKSPSERLRNVLYVYWNTKTTKEKTYDEFRTNYINKIIDNIKKQLDQK